MAIALPPPLPPQEAPAYELATQAQDEIVVQHGGVQLHVYGPRLADAETLRDAAASATNLSEAIRAIGRAQYLAGYPATVLSYAVTGSDDVHLRLLPGRVQEITGPPQLVAYFASLRDGGPLSVRELELARSLAGAHADRAGEDYRPQFRWLGGDEVALDLGAAHAGPSRTTLAATLNNHGNRYAGPYLAAAGLRQSLRSGAEFTLSGGGSLAGLDDEDAEPYWEAAAGASRTGAPGIFALEGRYADFRQRLAAPAAPALDGRVYSATLSWLRPLHADFLQRLNLQLQLGHSDEAIAAPPAPDGLLQQLLRLLGLLPSSAQDDDLLRERYQSAEVALSYAARFSWLPRPTEIEAGVAARAGIGGDFTGSAAEAHYLLWRPTLLLRQYLASQWAAVAEARFQFSDDRLPRQEQWILGGPSGLHAFQTGAGLGDEGSNLRAAFEWQAEAGSWLRAHEFAPRLFVEYGTAERAVPDFGLPAGRVEIADAGLEIGARLAPALHASVSAAWPIHRRGAAASPDGLDAQTFFFQLSARY